MKKNNEDKKNRVPILIVSTCMGLLISISTLVVMVTGITGFMYNMSLNQLTIFSSVILIIAVSTGCQFIVCKGLAKNDGGKSIMCVISILTGISVILSVHLSFLAPDRFNPIIVYTVGWFVCIVVSVVLTSTLVYASSLISTAIYGYAVNQDEKHETEGLL